MSGMAEWNIPYMMHHPRVLGNFPCAHVRKVSQEFRLFLVWKVVPCENHCFCKVVLGHSNTLPVSFKVIQAYFLMCAVVNQSGNSVWSVLVPNKSWKLPENDPFLPFSDFFSPFFLVLTPLRGMCTPLDPPTTPWSTPKTCGRNPQSVKKTNISDNQKHPHTLQYNSNAYLEKIIFWKKITSPEKFLSP